VASFRYHYYRFVNLPGNHSTGYIACHVERSNPGAYKKPYWSGNMNVAFKDCDREINFSLECRDDEEFENSLHKIDTMIEGLRGTRKALIAENKQRIRDVESMTDEERKKRKGRSALVDVDDI